jgi:hypothetical protein
MSDERVELRKAKQAVLASLKENAMAALERRGYDVRGKTTTQIREVLRHHPTKPKAA